MENFEKKETQNESGINNEVQILKNFTSENDFLEKFGADAFDKQRNLFEVIGENSGWNVDMNKEEITFGENLDFPIQVLGSFSHPDGTWLWIWENKVGAYSESIMKQALALKKYGEENNINLLKIGKFEVTEYEVHLIGMMASELFNSSCYYLGNYGQGSVLVTIKSDEIKYNSDDIYRIITVFPQFISSFGMGSHKTALSNYLLSKGYEIIHKENELIGEKNGKIITGIFNDSDLLLELKGK